MKLFGFKCCKCKFSSKLNLQGQTGNVMSQDYTKIVEILVLFCGKTVI